MNKEEIKQTVIAIRHHLHTIPELAMHEYKTSAYIAEKMKEFGFDVTTGIGGTGVVATLKCGDSDEMVGLRADFDALPITEQSGVPYASTHEGCFHGCGHDSHVATLMGAALMLKESRDFNGTAVFIFQPGEEPGLGAKAMIEDGLFEKFPVKEIYGQHNRPVLDFGMISICPGKAQSAEDDFWITIKGKGGHASRPHLSRDPLMTAGELLMALQTIVSRNINPLEAGTVTVCDIKTDGAMNAIPSTVTLLGDCRSYDPAVSHLIEDRMRALVQNICEMNGCEGELKYLRAFVPVINDPVCSQVVIDTAVDLYGADHVIPNAPMGSGSEDFAWYQEKVPGAFFNVGHKAPGKEEVYDVHNSHYIYNDDAILIGSEMFAEIIHRRLPQ